MAQTLTEDHAHRDIDDRLLPWPKVKDITGLSRTTAWRLQKAGDFPLPVVISPGRVGWRESELDAWKASRSPRKATPPAPRINRSFLPDEKVPEEPSRTAPEPHANQRSRKSASATARGLAGQMTFDF